MAELAFIIRWFAGLIFLASVSEKLEDPTQFRTTLRAYDIWPDNSIAAWAMLLTVWEGLLTVLLLTGVFHKWVSAIAALTFVGFGILVAYRLSTRGGSVPCGCGGVFGDDEISWQIVGRDLLLGLVTLLGAASPVAWPAGWFPAALTALGSTGLIWIFTTVRETLALAVKLRDQVQPAQGVAIRRK